MLWAIHLRFGKINDSSSVCQPQVLHDIIPPDPALLTFFFCQFKILDDDSESDPLAPMITWKDFQRLMPWEIVILVGGGYALAAGCKVLRIYVCVFLYYSTALAS